MRGELFLCLLQGDQGHAGLDLQFLLRIGEAGFLRCCRSRCNRCCRLSAFALRSLGACSAFGAGLALGFLLLFRPAQAFLAQFEALLGVFGFLLLLFQFADLALGGAVVLHQRDAGRADVGAGAALDAVEQVVRLELLVLLAKGKKVQLLR